MPCPDLRNRVGNLVSGAPGTGTITLGGAITGHRTFAAAYGADANVDVLIEDGAEWEIARDCTYTNSSGTLTRGTLEESSTGSVLNLTSAAKVYVVNTAQRINDVNVPSTTWAALPAANTVGKFTRRWVTDVGANGGSMWYSDGVSRWFPVGGNVVLAQANGSLASPLASLTGVTSADFVLPAGNPVIPAGMMQPGRSKLLIETHIRRLTATASAIFNVFLGKTASQFVASQSVGATANSDWRPYLHVFPTASNGFLRSNWCSLVTLGNTNAFSDITHSDIDFNSNQIIKFAVSGANTADQFVLTSYQVTVWP
jgi:hypothetical protein